MVCSQKPVRYYVRGALQRVTVSETRMGHVRYTEFMTLPSTVLTEAEEAAIVAFRRQTLLPLDDCFYAL